MDTHQSKNRRRKEDGKPRAPMELAQIISVKIGLDRRVLQAEQEA